MRIRYINVIALLVALSIVATPWICSDTIKNALLCLSAICASLIANAFYSEIVSVEQQVSEILSRAKEADATLATASHSIKLIMESHLEDRGYSKDHHHFMRLIEKAYTSSHLLKPGESYTKRDLMADTCYQILRENVHVWACLAGVFVKWYPAHGEPRFGLFN